MTTDVNEAHSPFSFVMRSTKLAFDYVHIWSEGSNDKGGTQSVTSNGIKITLTQPVGKYLLFSLPLFYKNGDGDAMMSTGSQTFRMDTFAINPLLIFTVKPGILKNAQGEAKPAEGQPLALSLSSGYRVNVTQKNDIQSTGRFLPIAPIIIFQSKDGRGKKGRRHRHGFHLACKASLHDDDRTRLRLKGDSEVLLRLTG